jgi:hypothetical protein
MGNGIESSKILGFINDWFEGGQKYFVYAGVGIVACIGTEAAVKIAGIFKPYQIANTICNEDSITYYLSINTSNTAFCFPGFPPPIS